MMNLSIGDRVLVKLDSDAVRYGTIIGEPYYRAQWYADRFPAKWLVRLDGVVNARWVAVTDIVEKRSSGASEAQARALLRDKGCDDGLEHWIPSQPWLRGP